MYSTKGIDLSDQVPYTTNPSLLKERKRAKERKTDTWLVAD